MNIIPYCGYYFPLKNNKPHNIQTQKLTFGNKNDSKDSELKGSYEKTYDYVTSYILKGKQRDKSPQKHQQNIERIFRLLFGDKVLSSDENGINLKSYNSKVHISPNETIPIIMLGIDEDDILSYVSTIQQDFDISNATISKFPPNLKSVGGSIICTQKQYEKFKNDILKVIEGPYIIPYTVSKTANKEEHNYIIKKSDIIIIKKVKK